MHSTFAVAAALAGVASAFTVSAPAQAAPAGFVTTYDGSFQITAVKASGAATKRDLTKRDACPTASGALVITLAGGVLTDQAGRIADIVSNYQFQFDAAPGQAGYIYNGGYSVGSNSSIALGGSTIFYECQSGSFYNLYSKSVAEYCVPINIDIIPCGAAASGVVSVASDGQPTASSAISAATDGQPQASSATAISQISDGQPQATSATAISQISDGQPQAKSATTIIPISQISDGQPQVPTAVISQISDGQVQAPTTIAITPTGVAISQISDGQPQAATSTVASASKKSNATASATSVPVTGSANMITIGSGLLAVVGAFVVALL